MPLCDRISWKLLVANEKAKNTTKTEASHPPYTHPFFFFFFNHFSQIILTSKINIFLSISSVLSSWACFIQGKVKGLALKSEKTQWPSASAIHGNTHEGIEQRIGTDQRNYASCCIIQLHLLKAIDKILCIGASVVLLTEQQVKLHEKFLQLPFADAKVFPAGGSLNSPELKQPNSFQADCSSSGFLEIIFTLVAIISNSLQCCKHNWSMTFPSVPFCY